MSRYTSWLCGRASVVRTRKRFISPQPQSPKKMFVFSFIAMHRTWFINHATTSLQWLRDQLRQKPEMEPLGLQLGFPEKARESCCCSGLCNFMLEQTAIRHVVSVIKNQKRTVEARRSMQRSQCYCDLLQTGRCSWIPITHNYTLEIPT